MLNHALIPAIKAPIATPFLSLVNTSRSLSIELPKARKPWGFYPVTKSLHWIKKEGLSSNRALTRDFSAMVETLTIRHLILLTMGNCLSTGAFVSLILAVVETKYPNTTLDEILVHLAYLKGCHLINIELVADRYWFCELS